MVTATTRHAFLPPRGARSPPRPAARATAAGSSARPSARAPSCTTRSPRPPTCPTGWTATQAPGSYRLEPTGTDRLFDFAVGPTSWKHETFPPRVPLTVGRRVEGQATFEDVVPIRRVVAFLGVRGCEIAALLTQDAVLRLGPAVDRDYVARRAAALVIAVECEAPASTCFCTSMGTGPEVTSGFDLAMTELDDGFVVRSGSPAGDHLLEALAAARRRPTSSSWRRPCRRRGRPRPDRRPGPDGRAAGPADRRRG